ncbi:MAG TPA: Pr6Pr family membrane protein [Dokdonella sp.]
MRAAPRTRVLTGLTAATASAALVLQYALMLSSPGGVAAPARATLRFFSFFTILSNLLVAAATTQALVGACTRVAAFFAAPSVRAAIALYIGITCAIYYFVLSARWSPRGAPLVAEATLHYVVPTLYLAWWLRTAERGRLDWLDPLRWLAFPLAFLLWTLARGAWLHEYPYPFLDVDAIGLAAVLRNGAAIGVLMLAAGAVLVAFDRSRAAPPDTPLGLRERR